MKILADSGIARLWNNIKTHLNNTYVPQTRTVNNKNLTADTTIEATDIQTSATDTDTVKESIDSILNDYLPITAGSTKPLTDTLIFKCASPRLHLDNTAIDVSTAPSTKKQVGQVGQFKVYYNEDKSRMVRLDGATTTENVLFVAKDDGKTYLHFKNGGLTINKGNTEKNNTDRAGWTFLSDTGALMGTARASNKALNFVNTNGKSASLIMYKTTGTANRTIYLPDEDGYFVSDKRVSNTITSNGITVQTTKMGPFVYVRIQLAQATGTSAKTYTTEDGIIPQMYRPIFRSSIAPVTQDPDNSQTLRYIAEITPTGQARVVTSGALGNNYQEFRGTYLAAYPQFNIFK